MNENLADQGENDQEEQQESIVDELRRRSLDDEVFIGLFINKVADQAFEKMEKLDTARRNRYTKNSAILAGLLVPMLIALGTAFYEAAKQSAVSDAVEISRSIAEKTATQALKYIVSERVDAEIDKEITRAREQINRAEQRWDTLNRMLRLNNIADRILKKGGFDENEADEALEMVYKFEANSSYRDIGEFPEVLEKFVDTFQGADRDDLVIPLEQKFDDVMLDTQGIVITMVESLGRMMVGYEALPHEMGDGRIRSEWSELVTRYHKYADAARDLRYPELPYAFDMILACMERQPESEINTLARRSQPLTDGERESVTVVATYLLDQSWRTNPDPFSERVRERSLDCFAKYAFLDPTGVLPGVLNGATASLEKVPAPEILITKPEGDQKLGLQDFESSLKLVHFWATSCTACGDQFPVLDQIYPQLQDYGVELIAIESGEDAASVLDFVKSQGTSFPVYVDVDGATVAAWPNVDELPVSFLVGREGNILETFKGPQDWRSPDVSAKIFQHIAE